MALRWGFAAPARRVEVGAGTLREVSPILREVGVRQALLVTTAGRSGSRAGEQVAERLSRAVVGTVTVAGGHATAQGVQQIVQQARRDGADGLVSFGGGGAVESAKAAAWFLEREAGTPGVSFADRPGVPHLALPTTWAGADGSGWFAMTDERSRQPNVAGGPTAAPMVAVHDADLALDVPGEVRAATALTALTHAFDALWSRQRTPLSDALAARGAALVLRHVGDAVGGASDDLRAVTDGAVLAARAGGLGPPGIAHAVATVLGMRAGLGDGIAHALVLPAVADWIGREAPEAVSAVGLDDPAAALRKLADRLGLPSALSDCGVDDEAIEVTARLLPSHPATRTSPVEVSEDGITRLLEAVF